MPKIESEVDKLLIYDPDKARSTTHIYISRPTPLEEKSLGKLFIVCEIDSPEKINHEIINIIQEELKNNYYYSEDTSVETAFENALGKVNQSLHRLISEGLTNWLEGFNIVIAVIKGTEICLSHVGRIHAFLIHANKIVDIIDQNEITRQKINPLKIFSNIVEGKVNPSDQVLFCTTSLLDYFSQEKLRRIISSTLPSEAANELEKILHEADSQTAFGAIIAKLIPQEEVLPEKIFRPQSSPPIRPQSPPLPEASMQELINQEKQTSEYLTPSILPNITRGLKNKLSSLNNFFQTKILKKEKKRTRPEMPYYYRQKEPRKGGLKKILATLGQGIKTALAGLASLVLALVNLFKKLEVEFHESEKLLPLIDKVLKKAKIELKDLEKIIVVTGPGFFTSVRIGIAVANALALSLKIPVVSFKLNEFKSIKDLINQAKKKSGKETALPFYGQKPNITKPKKKWLK